jgi:hypothetical protein
MAFKIIAAKANNKPISTVAIANNAITILNSPTLTYWLSSHTVKTVPSISNATLGNPTYRSGLFSAITVRMLTKTSPA